MTLLPTIAADIIEDIIRRHNRQIAELKAISTLAESDPEKLFQQLIRLEANLQDIRQGLYSAAYVALSCAGLDDRPKVTSSSIGDAAKTKRAQRSFRGR